jgi:ABC-2 type transport system ATP-binding protein
MLEVTHLTKRYGDVLAVDDLSFVVRPGEVVGLLGPNGAGKSTTLRVVAGFVAPSAGTAAVCGHDVVRDSLAARRALGYVAEGAPSYPEMTPRDLFRFVADVRGLDGAARRRAQETAVERLALGAVLERPIGTLSKGFRRRVALAQAILHDPPVLVLDEPTDGLDPNQKQEVRALIGAMAPGKTIVISTHILEEVEAVCTRAVVIAAGRLRADDTPRGLARRSRRAGAVTLEFERLADVAAALPRLAAVPGVASVLSDPAGTSVTALPASGARPLEAIGALAAREGWALRGLHVEPGRLDEVFRELTADVPEPALGSPP